ncbi:putative cell survival pathways protein [Entomophthora muscae]|uniref:Cell survival pathways protein n=1 Tax=Entomophthora muscae TaxID=34485 RepID=A0ACC2T6C2_9FUNG|nr:putative cell survival pathways protein [Entomophthora muscae]
MQPIHSSLPLEADKWTILKGAATETHTFYLFTPDNKFIFCQLAYAKISFIKNVQVTFSVISGKDHAFITSTCSSGSFKTSNEDLNARCDNMEIERSPDNGFRIKLFPKSGASGELNFASSTTGWKVGAEQPNVKHSFYIPCQVTGSLTIPKLGSSPIEVSGSGSYGHATLSSNPYSVFSISHFVLFNSERIKTINLTFKPLHKDTDSLVVQSFTFVDGKLYLASDTGNVTFSSSHNDSEVDLIVPDAIVVNFEGPALEEGTPNGKTANALLKVDNLAVIDRFDVLESIPYMLRKIVQAFITKPYIYQFYLPGHLTITVSDHASEPLEAEGQVYYELSYL